MSLPKYLRCQWEFCLGEKQVARQRNVGEELWATPHQSAPLPHSNTHSGFCFVPFCGVTLDTLVNLSLHSFSFSTMGSKVCLSITSWSRLLNLQSTIWMDLGMRLKTVCQRREHFWKKKKNLEMHVQQQAMWLSIPVGISEWAKEESICLSPQICTPPLIFSLSLFYNKGKWQKQRQEREMSRAGNLHKNSMPHIPSCPRL